MRFLLHRGCIGTFVYKSFFYVLKIMWLSQLLVVHNVNLRTYRTHIAISGFHHYLEHQVFYETGSKPIFILQVFCAIISEHC